MSEIVSKISSGTPVGADVTQTALLLPSRARDRTSPIHGMAFLESELPAHQTSLLSQNVLSVIAIKFVPDSINLHFFLFSGLALACR